MSRSAPLFLVLMASTLLGVLAMPAPEPKADSAGNVPLANGLAYGGIPYGSITGMLQDYFGSSRGLPSQTLSGGGLGSNYVYDLGNELLG